MTSFPPATKYPLFTLVSTCPCLHANNTLPTESQSPYRSLFSSGDILIPHDSKKTTNTAPTHPMPQLSQQVSRSCEEISTLTFPLVWTHTRSEIASAAPNAWRIEQPVRYRQKNKNKTKPIKLRTWSGSCVSNQ